MNEDRAGETAAVAKDFGDLKRRLARLVSQARPTDDNLHFARFQELDRNSWDELTELARDGLAKVRDHGHFFSDHDLYDDGMFWYELCLAISSTSVSYRSATGEPPRANQLKELVDVLVDISHYSARRPSDMYKRNREALGNVLWAAQDETLIKRARRRAGEIAETDVIAFVEDTIEAVRKTQKGAQG